MNFLNSKLDNKILATQSTRRINIQLLIYNTLIHGLNINIY